MNYQQIAAAVYQRCNHFDPYLPALSSDLARAWGGLFEKHRLSQDDLLAAVETIYDQHGNGYRPMPADIIGAARAIRQDRFQRQPLEHIEATTDDTADRGGHRTRRNQNHPRRRTIAVPAPPRHGRPPSSTLPALPRQPRPALLQLSDQIDRCG